MGNLENETLIKVTFRCKEEYKPQLQNSSCLLHLSIGQEYHEGEKFLATMDLVNSTFRSCYIMLCDTLQAHTLKMRFPNLSNKELYTKALQLGDQWLQENRSTYERLDIPYTIMRWDEWLQHKNYAYYRHKIDELYANDPIYRQAVTDTINKFLKRRNLTNDKNAFNVCREYILEECPILIPLWAETKCEFVIYPRFRTPAMAATYDHFLGNNPDTKHLLREVALKFNHRVKPKKFSFTDLKRTPINVNSHFQQL